VILVVEGPSAAGKTTWLSQWDPSLVIEELGRIEPPLDSVSGESEFWADFNAERWSRAMTVEATRGSALCDTDPLKLHYDYCRARAGVVSWTQFEAGVRACAAAIAQRRLGIADLILCAIPDVDTLDARRQGDVTRSRRNFGLHRDFGPGLRDWYGTLEALDAGRVMWAFPATIPEVDARDRHNLTLFNRWMNGLPHHPPLSENDAR
jgi:hypothetical protein